MNKTNVNTILVWGSVKKVIGQTPLYYKIAGWGRGIRKDTPGLIINPNLELVDRYNRSRQINDKLYEILYVMLRDAERQAMKDLQDGHMKPLQSYIVDLDQAIFQMKNSVSETLLGILQEEWANEKPEP